MTLNLKLLKQSIMGLICALSIISSSLAAPPGDRREDVDTRDANGVLITRVTSVYNEKNVLIQRISINYAAKTILNTKYKFDAEGNRRVGSEKTFQKFAQYDANALHLFDISLEEVTSIDKDNRAVRKTTKDYANNRVTHQNYVPDISQQIIQYQTIEEFQPHSDLKKHHRIAKDQFVLAADRSTVEIKREISEFAPNTIGAISLKQQTLKPHGKYFVVTSETISKRNALLEMKIVEHIEYEYSDKNLAELKPQHESRLDGTLPFFSLRSRNFKIDDQPVREVIQQTITGTSGPAIYHVQKTFLRSRDNVIATDIVSDGIGQIISITGEKFGENKEDNKQVELVIETYDPANPNDVLARKTFSSSSPNDLTILAQTEHSKADNFDSISNFKRPNGQNAKSGDQVLIAKNGQMTSEQFKDFIAQAQHFELVDTRMDKGQKATGQTANKMSVGKNNSNILDVHFRTFDLEINNPHYTVAQFLKYLGVFQSMFDSMKYVKITTVKDHSLFYQFLFDRNTAEYKSLVANETQSIFQNDNLVTMSRKERDFDGKSYFFRKLAGGTWIAIHTTDELSKKMQEPGIKALMNEEARAAFGKTTPDLGLIRFFLDQPYVEGRHITEFITETLERKDNAGQLQLLQDLKGNENVKKSVAEVFATILHQDGQMRKFGGKGIDSDNMKKINVLNGLGLLSDEEKSKIVEDAFLAKKINEDAIKSLGDIAKTSSRFLDHKIDEAIQGNSIRLWDALLTTENIAKFSDAAVIKIVNYFATQDVLFENSSNIHAVPKNFAALVAAHANLASHYHKDFQQALKQGLGRDQFMRALIALEGFKSNELPKILADAPNDHIFNHWYILELYAKTELLDKFENMDPQDFKMAFLSACKRTTYFSTPYIIRELGSLDNLTTDIIDEAIAAALENESSNKSGSGWAVILELLKNPRASLKIVSSDKFRVQVIEFARFSERQNINSMFLEIFRNSEVPSAVLIEVLGVLGEERQQWYDIADIAIDPLVRSQIREAANDAVSKERSGAFYLSTARKKREEQENKNLTGSDDDKRESGKSPASRGDKEYFNSKGLGTDNLRNVRAMLNPETHYGPVPMHRETPNVRGPYSYRVPGVVINKTLVPQQTNVAQTGTKPLTVTPSSTKAASNNNVKPKSSATKVMIEKIYTNVVVKGQAMTDDAVRSLVEQLSTIEQITSQEVIQLADISRGQQVTPSQAYQVAKGVLHGIRLLVEQATQSDDPEVLTKMEKLLKQMPKGYVYATTGPTDPRFKGYRLTNGKISIESSQIAQVMAGKASDATSINELIVAWTKPSSVKLQEAVFKAKQAQERSIEKSKEKETRSKTKR